MKQRTRQTKFGPSCDSPKQRKQQALAWLLHQCMGAQGSISVGPYHRKFVPPAVDVRLDKIRGQLKLMERELRYELANIK